MQLSDWMTKNSVTVIKLAQMLRTERCTIYAWLKGRNKPSPHFNALLEEITKGAVKLKDWYD